MDRFELEVERVAHGGVCVGRAPDGRAVLVRHALPGERVVAEVTDERPRFLRADAVEVLRASPDRVVPPCPFAGPGRCGGCDWQHATLEEQRRLKAAVIREQLQRLANVDLPVEVEQLPGSPNGLGWRTRVRFAVDREGHVGFRRHRSHDVEPVDACLLAHPGVEALGVETKRWPAAAEIEVAVSASTGDRHVDVTPRSRRRQPHVPWLDAPTGVSIAGRRLGGRSTVREQAAGREWHVSVGGFWQVHPAAAETLAAAVVEALGVSAGDTVLDLYAGVGLFAGTLAPLAGERGTVVAVESHPAAVRDAQRALGDLPQVSVVMARVDTWLTDQDVPRPDAVVLDPPRSGAGAAVVHRLVELAPRAVAYVACDPAALARDLATFLEAGWRLGWVRAFDLFPMTSHVECVAALHPPVPTPPR
jgi:tRNA/tmRNA/rRNA uracil-C5-methylase (TrmA/RlmC/RlmD family)